MESEEVEFIEIENRMAGGYRKTGEMLFKGSSVSIMIMSGVALCGVVTLHLHDGAIVLMSHCWAS